VLETRLHTTCIACMHHNAYGTVNQAVVSMSAICDIRSVCVKKFIFIIFMHLLFIFIRCSVAVGRASGF